MLFLRPNIVFIYTDYICGAFFILTSVWRKIDALSVALYIPSWRGEAIAKLFDELHSSYENGPLYLHPWLHCGFVEDRSFLVLMLVQR